MQFYSENKMNKITIASKFHNMPYDIIHILKGKFNPYTELVHWSDGSISKVRREMVIQGKEFKVNRTLAWHDNGIRLRSRN